MSHFNTISHFKTILHPHHVSLISNQNSLQSMLYQFQDRIDPYSEVDGAHIHSSVNSPRFNVSETETSYLLDGEFPGLADKRAISVEWTNNQVLIIRGTISPGVAENNLVYPSKNGLNNDGPPAADHTKGPKSSESAPVDAERSTPTYAGPRRILRERNIGDFQRSFTFPVGVDADKMEASLANGLLTLVVPKIASRSERKCIKVL